MDKLERAEQFFLFKEFKQSIELSLKYLYHLQQKEYKNTDDVIISLKGLRKVVPKENEIFETKSISILIQSLYELQRFDEASNLLSVYYTEYQYPPEELMILLIQMLLHIGRYQEAEKQMNILKKISTNMSQLVEIEFKKVRHVPIQEKSQILIQILSFIQLLVKYSKKRVIITILIIILSFWAFNSSENFISNFQDLLKIAINPQ